MHSIDLTSTTNQSGNQAITKVENDEEDDNESPLGSGEINKAMSQLEDVNPGTWSGRLPPDLPGMSPTSGPFYRSEVPSRLSMISHLHNEKVSTPTNHNDGDDKSVKSECLLVKESSKSAHGISVASISTQ